MDDAGRLGSEQDVESARAVPRAPDGTGDHVADNPESMPAHDGASPDTEFAGAVATGSGPVEAVPADDMAPEPLSTGVDTDVAGTGAPETPVPETHAPERFVAETLDPGLVVPEGVAPDTRAPAEAAAPVVADFDVGSPGAAVASGAVAEWGVWGPHGMPGGKGAPGLPEHTGSDPTGFGPTGFGPTAFEPRETVLRGHEAHDAGELRPQPLANDQPEIEADLPSRIAVVGAPEAELEPPLALPPVESPHGDRVIARIEAAAEAHFYGHRGSGQDIASGATHEPPEADEAAAARASPDDLDEVPQDAAPAFPDPAVAIDTAAASVRPVADDGRPPEAREIAVDRLHAGTVADAPRPTIVAPPAALPFERRPYAELQPEHEPGAAPDVRWEPPASRFDAEPALPLDKPAPQPAPSRGSDRRAAEPAIPSQAPPRPLRDRARKALRLAGYVAAGYLGLVLMLIVAYRFVNPPASTLMLYEGLFGSGAQQTWMPLERMSPNLVRAVLVSEDARFCSHRGIDLEAVEEAIERSKGGIPRGASTISMQVTKNLFLWQSKSFVRKLIELPLTLVMELWWPKSRILEVYLNIAEWGPGIFGAEAAAQHHFRRSAASLSERESALLAASLPNPILRDAGDPGPRVIRKAAVIQGRVRGAGDIGYCVKGR